MTLRVKDLLTYSSLKNANVMTESIGLDNEVSGAIVMEALDIEEWGRSGLILMTSYYALENVHPERIEQFFTYAKKIGIAGFIFKVDRLVSSIPAVFLESCQTYALPLIQIDKQTSYEKIVTDILETIINRNTRALEYYYDVHQRFAKLMLEQPGISEILSNLKNLIQMPATLLETVDEKIWTTDKVFHSIDLLGKDSTAYRVAVPNLGYEEYELIVHQVDQQLQDLDFVAVENATVALQTELIKEYALRKNNQSRLNEMASDLLHGRFSTIDHIKETVQDLNMSETDRYRVIAISFDYKEKDMPSFLPNRFADVLINHANLHFPKMIYVTRKERVIMIIPVNERSLADVKKKIKSILDTIHLNDRYKAFNHFTSISNDVDVFHLPDAYRQSFDTQKIMQMIGDPNVISTYNDLGIYQIFVETNNLDQLDRFIPDKIWRLKKENPDLLETLHVFIDEKQNFSETAQVLFVHPKTVRYRINKMKETYQIDFENPEEILHYSIAIRLLKIIEKK